MKLLFKGFPAGYVLVIVLISLYSLNAGASSVLFSTEDLTGWEEKSFIGNTQYRLVEHDDEMVLNARSIGSSSGLFNTGAIALDETPILNWRWKVAQIGDGNDEKTKAGDDFPVRLYVIVSGTLQFWKSYSLVYVWSNSAELNESWDNPYTSNVKHIAVETGTEFVGEWRSYQRNVRDDFERVFGVKPEKLKAVAIMTDSDNSGQKFEAWYGDIQFNRG